MKNLICLFSVVLMTSTTFGAAVRNARLDATGENVLVDVVYGGGCGPHDFSLKLRGCLESMPVQCTADLIEDAHGDGCEAMISRTAVLSLKKNKLVGDYFKGASLRILGDVDFTTGKPSVVSVRLP